MPGLNKMAKNEIKDQLLVVEFLARQNLVPCMSRSRLFMAILMGCLVDLTCASSSSLPSGDAEGGYQ
jgi:hypothetical protein